MSAAGTVAAVSRKNKPGTKVRYRWHGLRHVQELHAGKWRTWVVIGHKRRMILNESLPIAEGRQYIAHPQDAECGTCHYLYTHVMVRAKTQCDECDLEQAAERARHLEQQGIRLGWGFHLKDDALPEHDRERAHQANVIGK